MLFEQRFNAGGPGHLASLYEADGILVDPEGNVAAGRSAIVDALAGPLGDRWRIAVTTTQVVGAGDIALLCNRWVLSRVAREGSTDELHGGGTEVARQQPDGEWRYVIDASASAAILAGGRFGAASAT